MRPQSAKAKGRRLQQEVRDYFLTAFPSLEPDDVRSTSMGASGEDLLLSPAARKLIPFYIECKNVEKLNIHAAIAQAEEGWRKSKRTDTQPLVIFRKNATPTYVALPFVTLVGHLQRLALYGCDPLAPPRVGAPAVLRQLVDLNEAENGRYERAIQAMHEAIDGAAR